MSKSCDIIIAVWNQYEFTKRCIDSVRRNTRVPYRLILVDNASDSRTRDYLSELAKTEKTVELIRNEENLGFVKAVNKGLGISGAPYVCLLNNDTITTDGWLGRMMDLAEERPDIGLVNPQSEAPGRLTIDEYAELLAGRRGEYIETNQCMGFCMLIKREIIEKVGCLDEAFGMGGFDDADFSRRVHAAGYKCVTARNAYVYHKWHTSFDKDGKREESVRQNEKIYFDKWGKYLRIAFPVTAAARDNFISDVHTSFALAREWNWVHAWLNMDNKEGDILKSLNLPRHQSLRLFYISKNRFFFNITVLFKLIERSLKKKKHFDAVLITDTSLFKLLSGLKWVFTTPLVYINPDKMPERSNDDASWRRNADFIVQKIREEIRK